MKDFFSIDSTTLIALHGWGMDATCWDELKPLLQGKVTFRSINLPGYYDVPELPNMTIDSVVDWLAEQFEGKCHLLGWSMGGLVAQAFAEKYPDRLLSLSLVASTPCFVKKEAWDQALEPEVLNTFVKNLADNRNTTLRRFIALQFMGESAAANMQKQLRLSAPKQSTSLTTLNLGLTWLRDCDYRKQVANLKIKQHWMFGAIDQLIPVGVGQALKNELPDIMISYFNDCGHAPHMTQPERFADRLINFISQDKSE